MMGEAEGYKLAYKRLQQLAPDLAAGFPDPSLVAGRIAAPDEDARKVGQEPDSPVTNRERGSGRVFLRGRIWWFAYYFRGKEYRESSKSKEKNKALRQLRRRMKEIGSDELGNSTFVPGQHKVRVDELLDSLEAHYRRKSGRALPQFLTALRRVRLEFGDMRAIEVKTQHVEQYMDKRLNEDRRAPATVNRETQLLGQAFKLAVKREELAKAPYIPKLPENNVRSGFFERSEFEALVERLPEYLQDFARFAYLCAWRKGEIASLEWKDVDYDSRLLWLRGGRSNNGEARKIALAGELWEIFQRRWEARRYSLGGVETLSPLVFHRSGKPIGDTRKAWATACEAAGLRGKLFHDLRRTGVRNMDRAGVPQTVAMAISGHKTASVYRRYNITSDDDLREAVLQTDSYIRRQPKERRIAGLRR